MSPNSNNPLIKNLTDYGLSDKEAKVYLALLELEIASVQEIAKATGINRSSAYVVLEALKKEGLVSMSNDKKIQRYIASSPELLLLLAEDRARKQTELKEKIDQILPELKALHKNTKQRPKVLVFEGKNGLINAFEDSLKCRDKFIRVVSSAESLTKSINDYFSEYVKKRIKNNIVMKGIHPIEDITCKKLTEMMPKKDQSVFIPKNIYNFPANIAIYDNKIGYISPEDGGYSIIIESEKIANALKNIFDMAWKEGERLTKKHRKII